MCGRFVLTSRPAEIGAELLGLNKDIEIEPPEADLSYRQSYNFSPRSSGLILRQQKSTPASSPLIRCKWDSMEWGIVSPRIKGALRPINCRADSLAADHSAWAVMKRSQRCVVVCDGFYEWLKTGTNSKDTVPHYIRRNDRRRLYLAGLWEHARSAEHPDGLSTFTIVTTDANKQICFLHHRMPVILDPDSPDFARWLDCSLGSWTSAVQSVCRPYPDEAGLDIYPVGSEVGKVSNDYPSLIERAKPREPPASVSSFFSKTVKAEDDEPKEQDPASFRIKAPIKDETGLSISGPASAPPQPAPAPATTTVQAKGRDGKLTSYFRRL